MAGGPEYDDTPGKIASLIVNLVDSCLVGVYLQSALRGVSPIPPKAARANKQGGSPAAAQADTLEIRRGGQLRGHPQGSQDRLGKQTSRNH